MRRLGTAVVLALVVLTGLAPAGAGVGEPGTASPAAAPGRGSLHVADPPPDAVTARPPATPPARPSLVIPPLPAIPPLPVAPERVEGTRPPAPRAAVDAAPPTRKASRPRPPRITEALGIAASPPLRKVQTVPPSPPEGAEAPLSVPSTPVPASAMATASTGGPGSSMPVPPPGPPTPSAGWAATRVLAAFGTVGLLLVLTLVGYARLCRRGGRAGRPASGRARARIRPRPGWMARLLGSGAETDRIQILARSYVGTRESISVVQVGPERFLVGITGTQVSLLARLDADAPPWAPAPGTPAPSRALAVPSEPAATDFAGELRAATPGPATPPGLPADPEGRSGHLAEQAIRAALARSRARLERQQPAGAGRG